jgi:hypothetical protein
VTDVDIDGRLATWMDAAGLGVGAPLEHRYVSGGSQNEIYEIRRGDLHCALRIPPASAAPSGTPGSCGSGGSSRRSAGPTTFALSEAAAALRHVADGKAIGKVVLDIG